MVVLEDFLGGCREADKYCLNDVFHLVLWADPLFQGYFFIKKIQEEYMEGRNNMHLLQ